MGTYSLTEEQKKWARDVYRLALDELEHKSSEIDENARYPKEVMARFADFGLFGIAIPKQYGGQGRPLLEICLALEQLARVDLTAALCIGVNCGGLLPILLGGNEEQKSNYLSRLARGEYVIGVGFSEPGAGSDLGSLQTRAERRGDKYIVNGRKCFITNAGLASTYSLLARTGEGKNAISAFILNSDAKGFAVGRMEKKMGARGSPTGDLILEDCEIPVENLLGTEGHGLDLGKGMLRFTRPLIGAQGVGASMGILEHAAKFINENRDRFRNSMDVIRYKMGYMASRVEAARQLTYMSASLVDIGRTDASKFSSMAKYLSTDITMEIVNEVMQIVGLGSYLSGHPLERFMRDAKLLQIYEGTNQIQRATIAKMI